MQRKILFSIVSSDLIAVCHQVLSRLRARTACRQHHQRQRQGSHAGISKFNARLIDYASQSGGGFFSCSQALATSSEGARFVLMSVCQTTQTTIVFSHQHSPFWLIHPLNWIRKSGSMPRDAQPSQSSGQFWSNGRGCRHGQRHCASQVRVRRWIAIPIQLSNLPF